MEDLENTLTSGRTGTIRTATVCRLPAFVKMHAPEY